MRRRRRQGEEPDLDLTPMIDCIFLLLIFFMCTTVFQQPYSLRVTLPAARESQVVEEKKLVASIAADGRMEINRQPVSTANLEEVLRREKESTHSLTLIVRTDKGTKHKYVLDLFETAKRVGIEKIPLATDDKD